MPSGLEIKELHAGYNGSQVLKGISLDVHPGMVTALIGPSGCGKTTLLRCVNRLNELSKNSHVSGFIGLDGQDVRSMDPMLLRRKVGMVFQKPNPFPMSVRENILYGIKAGNLKVDADAIIESSLRKASIWDELKDRLEDNAFGLSVGQQQRVCIARCLAISPEIILMDEPAASLDPSSSARVETSIMSLKGEYTVMIVTHNMQQAKRISDTTVFLFQGEIIEAGETEQIFNRPQRQETREYIDGRFG
jgi:phosphate transport system ATP-binding protein